MKFHLIDTSVIFIDSTHVKACANSKKMRNRVAHKEALWFEEELKKEIDEDRKNHGKKPLKDKDDNDNTPSKPKITLLRPSKPKMDFKKVKADDGFYVE